MSGADLGILLAAFFVAGIIVGAGFLYLIYRAPHLAALEPGSPHAQRGLPDKADSSIPEEQAAPPFQYVRRKSQKDFEDEAEAEKLEEMRERGIRV